MAAIIWTDVEAHAPELSTVDPAAQTDILAFVNVAHDVDELDGEAGPRTKLARIYLAAHFATASASGSASGSVTRERAGDLEREYGSESSAFSTDPTMLATTGYGQMYLSLIRTSKARAPFLL